MEVVVLEVVVRVVEVKVSGVVVRVVEAKAVEVEVKVEEVKVVVTLVPKQSRSHQSQCHPHTSHH